MSLRSNYPVSRLRSGIRSIHRERIFAAVLLLAFAVGIVAFIKTPLFGSWDFRNNLWGPAYLLVHGQSPYHISTLFENSNALWFPMAIGLFFPFGWLTQSEASNLWLLGNI